MMLKTSYQSQTFIFVETESTLSIIKKIPSLYFLINTLGDYAVRIAYLIEQSRFLSQQPLFIKTFKINSAVVALGIGLINHPDIYVIANSTTILIQSIKKMFSSSRLLNIQNTFFYTLGMDLTKDKEISLNFNIYQENLLALPLSNLKISSQKQNKKYNLHRATSEHAALLSNLMRQYEDEIYGPNAILRNRDYYELRSKNSILNLDYFILYCDNYIVGYIGTWASIRNTAHIAEIWITSPFRGQGLTKILLEKAILTLMASGLDRIIFQTGHPAVMKICQKLGAYLVGPWTKICYK